MYRVLKTSSKTIISSDEVIFATSVDNNTDTKVINQAIQIAEARFILPLICKDMFEYLKENKNVVVTSINKDLLETQVGAILKIGGIVNAIEFIGDSWYNELWNEYLWKLIAECVIYIASPVNFSRFTSQGEMENNPKSPLEGQASASVSLATMKWKMDKMMQDRIAPLIAPTEQWLYDNRTHFPLVNCKNWTCSTIPDGVATRRKTPWIFGIYDLDNTKCGCNEDN